MDYTAKLLELMKTGRKSQPEDEPRSRILEIDQILGAPPTWLVRSGIGIIFVALVMFFGASWFIKYPDIISSQIMITTENVPATIVARTNGKIVAFLVQDGQPVKTGQILAIIESSADYLDVLCLSKFLSEVKAKINETRIPGLEFLSRRFDLGDLQLAYSSFQKAYLDRLQFVKVASYPRRVASLNQQIGIAEAYAGRLSKQTDILGQDLIIVERGYERDSLLFGRKLLSASDLEKSRSSVLQKQYTLETAKSSFEAARLQLAQLQQSLLDLSLQYAEQDRQLRVLVSQSYDNLLSQLGIWEQSYLLKAPISGIVSFNKFWSANQNVTIGSKVLTVVPQKSMRIVGKVTLPVAGAGKIKAGQRVNIKISDYPYMDYGMLKGSVKAISLVAADNTYAAEVELDTSLRTNYGKDLAFTHEMSGIAEIITSDIRLIERFVNPVKSVIKRSIHE